MIGRIAFVAVAAMFCLLPQASRAQDVPGIEICTVEKTMERRTSCLQSNVDFLQKTIAKLALDNQRRIDAANRQIDGLKAAVASLEKLVEEQKKAIEDLKKPATPPARDAAPAAKEGAK
jgi:flagellar motility protein MotE (MotC chaperone)